MPVKPSMLRPDLLPLLLAVSVQARGGGGHQGELGQDSCHTVCTCNLVSVFDQLTVKVS